MKISDLLRKQLDDLFDAYRKYSAKTFGIALLASIMSFLVAAILFRYSDFDKVNSLKPISLLSFFITRFSTRNTYCLADLMKVEYLFFISLYAMGLCRQSASQPVTIGSVLRSFLPNDIFSLLGALLLASMGDFVLFKLSSYFETGSNNFGLLRWLSRFIFQLRIILPLVIFSTALLRLVGKFPARNVKWWISLIVSLWIFNEFAYEVLVLVSNLVFGLILIPFAKTEKEFLFESILSIPLMAWFVTGFASVMMNGLETVRREEIIPA